VKNRYSHLIIRTSILAGCILSGSLILSNFSVQARALVQQPTGSIPTVTGTPEGATVKVYENQMMINVHTGPGQAYPVIGILVAGQKVPALGMDRDGKWVLIVYMGVPGNTGWVAKSLVDLKGELVVVTPPPTPSPRETPTLDPTLAARYAQPVVAPTRLPTYTVPAPLIVPTFTGSSTPLSGGNFPLGFLIIGLAVLGLFGTLLSFLRGR
jgi:hypothetical protein